MRTVFIVKDGKAMDFFLCLKAEGILKNTLEELARSVEKISGVRPQIKETETFQKGVCFALFSQLDVAEFHNQKILQYERALQNTDGFAVALQGDCLLVLSHTYSGLYFGAHDLLEKNACVVWGRGAKEYEMDYSCSQEIEIAHYDYMEKSPFAIRVWNTCGTGSTGKDHVDDGTAKYYANNKTNGMFHAVEPYWNAFGLRGVGIVSPANNIDDLETSHPEYFMCDFNGQPKTHVCAESFINYYNADVAKEVAKRFVKFLETADNNNLYSLIMPDNPYFYMQEAGRVLHELPFTADDGTVVEPSAKNYKSTVYFNYMNRVVREINRLRPNTDVLTFAYLYSEEVPAIQTDEHLIVSLAPIYTNERYTYLDVNCKENQAIADNIRRWAEQCKKLCIYSYWNSFRGTVYMRPILKQVKENLLWFEQLGVYGITAEGKLDCSIVENMTDGQKNARLFFDMNEACSWVMQKLIFNPRQDINRLLRRYANIVYKEVAQEFIRYYELIEKGFESQDAYVWYPTGGDVYILQFIINAGIKDEVLSVLQTAKRKAVTPSVKTRIESIYETVKTQMDKYADFVKEEATVMYTSVSKEEIVGVSALDYKNNPKSVWNTAQPIKVLRNYNTMAHYDKNADFECRMLCTNEHLYVGYAVNDDEIASVDEDENGHIRVLRNNGERLISYAETYIGGNELNQSTYYGYISGFRESKAYNAFYKNSGVPQRVNQDCGLEDYYFVKTDCAREKRYCFHVQKIPIRAIGATADNFTPYGSFVYYSNRFGRAGWMGFGLWSKKNFQSYKIRRESNGSNGTTKKENE